MTLYKLSKFIKKIIITLLVKLNSDKVLKLIYRVNSWVEDSATKTDSSFTYNTTKLYSEILATKNLLYRYIYLSLYT